MDLRQVPRKEPSHTHGTERVRRFGERRMRAHCTLRDAGVYHEVFSTRGRGALQPGDVVPQVPDGAFIKNGVCNPYSPNGITFTDDTNYVVFGDGNVVGMNCITNATSTVQYRRGGVHAVRRWISCRGRRVRCERHSVFTRRRLDVLSLATGVSSGRR